MRGGVCLSSNRLSELSSWSSAGCNLSPPFFIWFPDSSDKLVNLLWTLLGFRTWLNIAEERGLWSTAGGQVLVVLHPGCLLSGTCEHFSRSNWPCWLFACNNTLNNTVECSCGLRQDAEAIHACFCICPRKYMNIVFQLCVAIYGMWCEHSHMWIPPRHLVDAAPPPIDIFESAGTCVTFSLIDKVELQTKPSFVLDIYWGKCVKDLRQVEMGVVCVFEFCICLAFKIWQHFANGGI